MLEKSQLKIELRKKNSAKDIKSKKEKSEAIYLKVISSPHYVKARSIFVYLSTNGEVSTDKIVEDALNHRKIVLVPVIVGKKMVTHIINKDTLYEVGKYSIKTPINGRLTTMEADLTIVPMLGFFNKERLGKGGGYYDRYLATKPSTYKMGICFSDYVSSVSFAETHDIGMDEILVD